MFIGDQIIVEDMENKATFKNLQKAFLILATQTKLKKIARKHGYLMIYDVVVKVRNDCM